MQNEMIYGPGDFTSIQLNACCEKQAAKLLTCFNTSWKKDGYSKE
jgi:hypothetical protein